MALSGMFSVTLQRHVIGSALPGVEGHPSSPISSPCDASASSWLGLLSSLTFANAHVFPRG